MWLRAEAAMIVGVSLPRLLLSNLLLNSMTSAFSRKVSRVSSSFSENNRSILALRKPPR